MSKRAVNLLRKMALPYKFDKTNPLTGNYRKVLTKTANYTCLNSDSGAILRVNAAATTLIQLPAAASNAGWHITIIIDEDAGGTLDQKVNVGTLAGEFFMGTIWCSDGGGNSNANGSSNDFINCATTSSTGLRFEIHSDGTYMHCTGWAVDASDTKFADAAG